MDSIDDLVVQKRRTEKVRQKISRKKRIVKFQVLLGVEPRLPEGFDERHQNPE